MPFDSNLSVVWDTPHPEKPALSSDEGEARLPEHLSAAHSLTELLIEASHDSIQILDLAGRIIFTNKRGADLMEETEPKASLGRVWVQSFHGSDAEAAHLALNRASAGNCARFEPFCATALKKPKWWSVALHPIRNQSGRVERVLVISRDRTEHLQVEKALRESEEGFRKIFEEGPLGMVLGDTRFKILKVNDAFCRMIGYSEKELAGLSLEDITHPEDLKKGAEQMPGMLAGDVRSVQIEKRFLTRRKRVVSCMLTVSLVHGAEGSPLYSVSMIENIDDRKRTEEKFLTYQDQLQSLASELSLSEERERRRIATGLHDRIGQTLAFAKLKLGALSQNSAMQECGPLLNEIRGLIEQSLSDTRSLTFELSPPVLYELGLVPALEWLVRRIQQEHGINTRFHDDEQAKTLDEDVRVVLFQAVRELLVNVVKHSKAQHAQVLVRRDSDALRIVIEDDGIGFDPSRLQSTAENSGFGLFSIKERLQYLGGQVKIRSEVGHGARITLIAPLKFS